MEKDGFMLIEQAMILLLSGLFGNFAYDVSQASYSLIEDIFLYSLLLLFTISSVGLLHYSISFSKVYATRTSNTENVDEKDGLPKGETNGEAEKKRSGSVDDEVIEERSVEKSNIDGGETGETD